MTCIKPSTLSNLADKTFSRALKHSTVVAICLLGTPALAQTPLSTSPTANSPAPASNVTPNALEQVQLSPTIDTVPALPDTSADGTIPPLPSDAFAGNTAADPEKSVIVDRADSLEEDKPGHWVAKGNVQLHYRGYQLTSERVDMDMDAGTALFSGHPKLLAPDTSVVDGGNDGTLLLDLHKETFTVKGAHATIPPQTEYLGELLPIFVFGGTIVGRKGLIDARGSSFTTCDFLQPHYYFEARSLDIVPDKSLIAHHVTLYRKGHPVITIPYFYAPLDRRFARQTLAPQVGYDQTEGYFIKLALGYALTSSLPGILRLDAMSYQGIGTGFEQSFGSTKIPNRPRGLFNLYNLDDTATKQDNLTGSLTDTQKIDNVNVLLNSQFQKNAYQLGSNSQSLSTQLNLNRNVGDQSTSLNTNFAQSNYGAGNSNTITSAFTDIFSPKSYEHLTTQINLNSFSAPGSAGANDHTEVDPSLDYAQTGRRLDFEILASKDINLVSGSLGNLYYGGVERLPEFRLATDARRLPFLKEFLPPTTKMNLSVGDFNEPSQSITAQRFWFNMDTGVSTEKISKSSVLNYGGMFEQGIYSDNAAEYVLNGRSTYTLHLGKKSSLVLNYDYLRPYGFSPFQFDVVGSTNLGTLALGLLDDRRFKLQLGTGYDINRSRTLNGIGPLPWQNLTAQTQFTPNRHFVMNTNGAYDLNASEMQSVSNTLQYKLDNGLAFNLASQYAPPQHRFATVNSELDCKFFWDKREDAGWKVQAIEGYNGFTDSFTYKGLALTRSWHDWEATIIYQDNPIGVQTGSTITFNFRLKAFPAYQPFGTGTFGQSFSPGVGQYY